MPALVVGFAAETQDLLAHASAKRLRKGCDWIVANLVADGAVLGADSTACVMIDGHGSTDWGTMSKAALAARLVDRIAEQVKITP